MTCYACYATASLRFPFDACMSAITPKQHSLEEHMPDAASIGYRLGRQALCYAAKWPRWPQASFRNRSRVTFVTRRAIGRPLGCLMSESKRQRTGMTHSAALQQSEQPHLVHISGSTFTVPGKQPNSLPRSRNVTHSTKFGFSSACQHCCPKCSVSRAC